MRAFARGPVALLPLVAVLAAASSTAGCKSPDPAPSPASQAQIDPAADSEAAELEASQILAAAGVELQIPGDWAIVVEDEPNFAMATGPDVDNPRVPVCTIEVRRQGPGPLPVGVKQAQSSTAGDTDYVRGRLRGRIRELPGPSPDARVLVHCRSPQAARWGAIEAGFAALKVSGPPEAEPALTGPAPIVELCASSPSRRTYTCARRSDGAVFCGQSTGDALTQVTGLEPSAQISCDGVAICSRSAAGAVACWKAGDEAPAILTSVGAARDLGGNAIVDEHGKVWHRSRELDGSVSEQLVELVLATQPELTRADVDQVLPGSSEVAGCVIRAGQVSCWDPESGLGIGLGPDKPSATLDGLDDPHDLALIGGRVCVATGPDWTCVADDARFRLDDCGARPCGCSLIGSARMSCNHEPHLRIDTRPHGRVAGVVAVSGPCAALVDGSVVCRGPVTGQREDQPEIAAIVAGGMPGVLHRLELREAEAEAVPAGTTP